jgi:hypothetical protein
LCKLTGGWTGFSIKNTEGIQDKSACGGKVESVLQDYFTKSFGTSNKTVMLRLTDIIHLCSEGGEMGQKTGPSVI